MTRGAGTPPTSLPRPAPLFVWNWPGATVAVLAALPAAYVALDDVPRAAALAVGILPAAAIGINPERRKRIVLLAAGPLIGLPLVAGAAIAGSPALATVCLCLLAALGGRLASAKPAALLGGLLTVLVIPMVAIGLSFDDAGSALRIAGLFVIASILVWLGSLAIPGGAPIPRPPAEVFPDYWWILVAVVATVTSSIGFALHLDHVGWACGAALLVLRPNADLQCWRTLGRFVSVVCGAALATLLVWAHTPNVLYALLIPVIVAVAAGTVGSRFYILPLFTTFFVILLLGHADADTAQARLNERVGETLLGLAVAAIVGIGVPALLRYRSRA
ncbi:FUSC family protein [Gordonia sp. CPCC 205333]|uniref:FUSC family protein n=1 Tax=Gordonia sp. CPCC 205333 TaxID=3140790 RepID=UPI003AF39981